MKLRKAIVIALAMVMCISMIGCGGGSGSGDSSASPEASSAGASNAPASPSTPATGEPTSTGSGSGNSGKTIKAYYVGIMSGGAAWTAAQKGFEDACAELGWEGQYLAPTTPNDTTQMVTLAETAITNNADVLLGTFYSKDIFGDVIGRAKEKGVLVATGNCFMDEELQEFWIGTDPEGMGITQAKTLVELAGDKEVTVVYMQTQATTETQNEQFEAMKKYLEDYENITVFGQEFCNSDAIVAADKMNALTKANPEINAAIAADGEGGLGIANYVEENGKKDDFISIGIDDSGEILNYVKSGALDCSIAQDFYKMGYEACMMLADTMESGKKHEFANDSGTIVIMPDDVDAYATEKDINLGE